MSHPVSSLCAALLFLSAASAQGAAPAGPACSAQSPGHAVALVELYTSEGCSSCPPADRWLSGLAATGYDAQRIIPLAFHVDYWDYLGWRDRYASTDFSDRQKEQARLHRSRVVYTPQVFVDSHDFRGWDDANRLRREIERINTRPSAVRLTVAAEPPANGQLRVDLQASTKAAGSASATKVYLALYEMGLESDVTAGENKDVHLRHDYVVRALAGPFALAPSGSLALQRTLALPADLNPARAGLVAFTESDRSDGSRQAVALALDRCAPDK